MQLQRFLKSSEVEVLMGMKWVINRLKVNKGEGIK